MNKKARQIIASMGSVLAIAPTASYGNQTPVISSDQRIQQAWQKTGSQLNSALSEYNKIYASR